LRYYHSIRPTRRLALVMCSGEKAGAPCQAANMFRSERFLRDKQYVESNGIEWRILSGRHGVLDPETLIEPYDESLDGASWLTAVTWFLRITVQIAVISRASSVELLVSARGAYAQWAGRALRMLCFRHDRDGSYGQAHNFAVWRRTGLR